MCGLIASISQQDDLRAADVSRMLQLANHRGPDGSDIHVVNSGKSSDLSTASDSRGWAVLGHVRLAIIDTSSSNSQPMVSRCRRYSLVFNGEIYNYEELRQQLIKLGAVFETRGDTEVLMQALMEWGDQALNRLRGMFAFVFVDGQKRQVLAGRDRYGIKPLYSWNDGNHIHFASEIKQFTAHPKWKSRLEHRKALEFLLYGVTDFDADTLFRGVHHVVPGTLTSVQLGRSLVTRSLKWWNPQRESFRGTYEDAVNEYQNRFHESLALHMRSDVEVASCLSGGLDSSAIVGSLSGLLEPSQQQFRTFTAISENSSIDESRFARAVNDFSGTSGSFVLPTSEKLWAELDRLIWHQDEPFASTSIFAQWCVFEAMQNSGVKVALDGQGADEQLGGYNSFITTKILGDFRMLQFGKAIRDAQTFLKVGRISVQDLVYASGYQLLPGRLKSFLGRRRGIASQNAGNWVKAGFRDSVNTSDPFASKRGPSRTGRQLSWDMVDRTNLPMLLRFEDRNSMAFGVEARVPFVDHELMEFALGLPLEYLIRNGNTKSVLRDAVSSFLPNDVLSRRDKIGFQTNEWHWLHQDRLYIDEMIHHGAESVRGILSDEIRTKVQQILASESRASVIPWRVLCFARWSEIFDVDV